MAEPENTGTGGSPKEMSMEMRLLLAFLLMGVVMYFTPYLFKSKVPPGKTESQATTTQEPAKPEQAETKPAAPPAEAPAEASAETAKDVTPQQVLPPFVIETDLYRIVFENHGATVRSWQLKKYRGNDGKPLDLVNEKSGMEWPFSLYFTDQQPTSKVNWAYFKQTAEPDGLGVSYEYSDGRTSIRKAFRFTKNSYLSEVSTEATLNGKPLPHLVQWRGGFGDLTVQAAAGNQRTLFYDLNANKLHELTVRDAKNGPSTAAGNFSFAGIADQYFAAVFLPEGSSSVKQVTFADSAPTRAEPKAAQYTGVAVADGDTNRFELFVGPKDLDLLKRVNPKLEQVVDFGWLSMLAKPLFLIVNWFNDAFVHNFGWAIVIVTIAINFILFPLKLSNMKSMRKMQALKPQIDAINDKYRGFKMTDPRKADQNQEVMALYKKHGVNPAGGCFPMLIQIPFFFAFYKVFTVSVEMRGAPWLWVTDLSQPEHLPIKILPIVMIASQFIMQKMTPQPSGDPNQQKMMMFMPLIFGFMFYNFPSGLVLYYLTSNLVSMGQQWFFNHTESAQEAARSVEPPKKKNGKK